MAEITQSKKITVGFVFSWFFGIIFLLAGIGMILTSPVAGTIYILLALYILPPLNEMLVKATGFHLTAVLNFLLVVVVAGLAGTMYSSNLPVKNPELVSNQNTSQSSGQVSQSQKSQSSVSKIVPFATEMKLSDFTVMIDKVDYLPEIDSGNQFLANYKPTNKILRIRFSGANNAKEDKFLRIGSGVIETKDGYKFKQLDTSNYLTIGSAQQISQSDLEAGFKGCLSCDLPPLGKAKEYMFFDIPERDLTDLTLTFKDYQFALK